MIRRLICGVGQLIFFCRILLHLKADNVSAANFDGVIWAPGLSVLYPFSFLPGPSFINWIMVMCTGAWSTEHVDIS